MNPRKITGKITGGLAAVATLAAAVGVGYLLGSDPSEGVPPSPPISLANADLIVAPSCDDLLDSYLDRALEQVGPYGWGSGIVAFDSMAGSDASAESASPTPTPASGVTTSRSTSNEAGTNVQEGGVDESDVVKVAGSLLLRMREGELLAYDVSGDVPSLLSSTRIDEARGNGLVGDPGGEMVFVDGRAVVLGSSGDGRSTTITTVDLSDPTSPSIADTTTVQARASALRLHDDVVRVVLNNGLPELDFSVPDGAFGQLRAELRNRGLVRDTTLSDWLPIVDGDPIVDCADVAIPDHDEIALGTTTVLAFDPADPATRTATAVATDSDTSYFSTDRFYLAAGGPQWGTWTDCMDCRMGVVAPSGTTALFAFALDGPDATYVASGEVEGTIADRWSMDAVGASLRVAVGPSSETGNFNSVLTLREDGADLVEEGRVDDLGIDEQITSVRWFDDLAIVVTFRQTDPLYAVDLSDPADPRLLGELKIPGFSDYLHPLGEHRLIGVGQDATSQGVTRGAQAALFDVTDLTDPRRIDVVSYPRNTLAGAGLDPRQFTWLPEQRVALTVVSRGWTGTTGWVSVLSLADGSMTNRMVEVEHGSDVAGVRLVPLQSGRVALVTGADVSFFDISGFDISG